MNSEGTPEHRVKTSGFQSRITGDAIQRPNGLAISASTFNFLKVPLKQVNFLSKKLLLRKHSPNANFFRLISSHSNLDNDAFILLTTAFYATKEF